jgi:hypothetical protein
LRNHHCLVALNAVVLFFCLASPTMTSQNIEPSLQS